MTHTTESLLAELEAKKAERETLLADLRQANARAYDVATDLETMQTIRQGPEAVEREMRRLTAMIRTVETTRDSYATRVVELKRTQKWHERRVRDATVTQRDAV